MKLRISLLEEIWALAPEVIEQKSPHSKTTVLISVLYESVGNLYIHLLTESFLYTSWNLYFTIVSLIASPDL